MREVTFGRTGANISEMCLGTMMFGTRADEAESNRIVSAAMDHGVNFLDTAAAYGGGRTEEILGRVLAARRSKVFIGTKVHAGTDYATITRSIDESLKRLQTDYVDLYMIHWPRKGMKPEETMRALNDVVKAGKARWVGCCNYPAWLLAHSNRIARLNGWPELACNQIPYNPVERGVEVEVLPQALAEGIAITVYRPLFMGLLSGKYHPDRPLPADSRAQDDARPAQWLKRYADGVRAVLDLAAHRQVPPSHVAIAWIRACPAVTCPIIGASRLEQALETIKTFDFALAPAERDAISKAFVGTVVEDAAPAYPDLRRELHLTA